MKRVLTWSMILFSRLTCSKRTPGPVARSFLIMAMGYVLKPRESRDRFPDDRPYCTSCVCALYCASQGASLYIVINEIL
ncbi:hypothetical protein GGX14DRAFT_106934 [Mycena pura]|uniref:Secreted protein n=1 Tax=Mycena pura TaxID=153505 RepID=A0AAD6YH48_9AGAR|nr:hypothetical protein GGX14DRAFT_106934 [Mycena pura]